MAADLATVEARGGRQDQASYRRDNFGPRRQTDLPGREVNATIRPDDDNGAEQLQRILGLAVDTATQIGRGIQQRSDTRNAGQAAMDATLGQVNQESYHNIRAYRQSYDYETGVNGAVQLDTQLTQAITDRLNDTTNPAHPEEITRMIDQAYQGFALDEQGHPRNFGSPQAARAVATQLAQTRARLTAGALSTIRTQTNAALLETTSSNMVFELANGGGRMTPAAPATATAPLAPGEIRTVDPNVTPAATAELGADGTASPDVSALGEGTTAPNGATATGGEAPVRIGSGFPVAGAITASHGGAYGQHRSYETHRGIDIPRPVGTQVMLPSGGRVVFAGHTAGNAGNMVKVDHGNGLTTIYAHLSRIDVHQGQTLSRGGLVGLSGGAHGAPGAGNSTGPHLHFGVQRNGQWVDPSTVDFGGGAVATPTPDGSADHLTPVPTEAPVPGRAAPIDFEQYMARVPTTIPRAQAKQALLAAAIQAADENHDDTMMDGLWQSRRSDGTPSFNPQEIGLLRDERDRIREWRRTETNRVRQETWSNNADTLLAADDAGNPPSAATVIQWERERRIDPTFAHAYLNNREAQARQDAREATADARQVQAQADADLDVDLSAQAESLRSGLDLGTHTIDDLTRMYHSGAMGTGRRASARYRLMLAARRDGERANLQRPEVVAYTEQLRARLTPPRQSTRGGGLVASALGHGGANQQRPYNPVPAALADYRRRLENNETPAMAAFAVLGTYGPAGRADVVDAQRRVRAARIADLQARAGQGR